jgi:hypothetical protein
MRVHMMIELLPGRSVGAPEMTDILKTCCRRYFAYALSDPRDKTIVCQLADARGRSVGDVVASFQPLKSR